MRSRVHTAVRTYESAEEVARDLCVRRGAKTVRKMVADLPAFHVFQELKTIFAHLYPGLPIKDLLLTSPGRGVSAEYTLLYRVLSGKDQHGTCREVAAHVGQDGITMFSVNGRAEIKYN